MVSRVARVVYSASYLIIISGTHSVFSSSTDPKTMYYKVVYDEDGDAEDLFASGVKEILVE